MARSMSPDCPSGLKEGERVAGFVYIGTAQEKPEERKRPDIDEITTAWTPEGKVR